MIELWPSHRYFSLRRGALMLFLFGLMSCGIEVGNPHDETTGKTPAMIPLTIAIADSPMDNLSHLYLNIKGISLITQGNDQLLSLSLADTAGAPVDVLSLQDGLTEILVKEQNIPPARYSGFVLELAQEKIGWVVEKSGAAKSLSLPLSDNHYLWISQEFNLAAADQIVLHMDILQSLRQGDDGNYQLIPVFNPISSREASALQGTIPGALSGVVCSYLQSVSPDNDSSPELAAAPSGDNALAGSRADLIAGRSQPKGSPWRLSGDAVAASSGASADNDSFRPLPPDGSSHHARVPGIGPRPRGPGAGGPSKDAPFGNCFISTPVHSDGSFRFHFLRPGTYTLRYYPATGAAMDLKGVYTVARPAEGQKDGGNPPPPKDIGPMSPEAAASGNP